MYHFLIIDGEYIVGIGESNNMMPNCISNDEAENHPVLHPPVAPDGYEYKLRADSLLFELCKIAEAPAADDELTPEEALAIILGGVS